MKKLIENTKKHYKALKNYWKGYTEVTPHYGFRFVDGDDKPIKYISSITISVVHKRRAWNLSDIDFDGINEIILHLENCLKTGQNSEISIEFHIGRSYIIIPNRLIGGLIEQLHEISKNKE